MPLDDGTTGWDTSAVRSPELRLPPAELTGASVPWRQRIEHVGLGIVGAAVERSDSPAAVVSDGGDPAAAMVSDAFGSDVSVVGDGLDGGAEGVTVDRFGCCCGAMVAGRGSLRSDADEFQGRSKSSTLATSITAR